LERIVNYITAYPSTYREANISYVVIAVLETNLSVLSRILFCHDNDCDGFVVAVVVVAVGVAHA
jgi:hypothetical protein